MATQARTSNFPLISSPPRWLFHRSATGILNGRPAAARVAGWKLSIAATTVSPRHHAASAGSVGADTRFWPVGPTAGSHCTAVSLKPQLLRKGSSCSPVLAQPCKLRQFPPLWRYVMASHNACS